MRPSTNNGEVVTRTNDRKGESFRHLTNPICVCVTVTETVPRKLITAVVAESDDIYGSNPRREQCGSTLARS